MQIYETHRIQIILEYDMACKRTIGKIFSKIEDERKNELWVGIIVESLMGTPKLEICKKYEDKSYIKEDFEKLKPEIESYINMWHERASRGFC